MRPGICSLLVLVLTPCAAATTAEHRASTFAVLVGPSHVMSCAPSGVRHERLYCVRDSRGDDRSVVEISATGSDHVVDSERGANAWLPPRRLRPGQWWRFGAFGCHARREDLTCWNRDGRGFRIGYRRGINRFP